MPRFRLGLVGAGRMGRTHLRALGGSERVAVTAIAEMSAAAREAVAAPGVMVFASPAEMLEAAVLDGVLVVAPTDQHGAIIAEVAARGLPILCEKPCGLTAAAVSPHVGPDGRGGGRAAPGGLLAPVRPWPAAAARPDRRGRVRHYSSGHLLPVG